MTKLRFIALAALAAGVIAGCGGSSNKNASYSDTGKKLDAICTKVNPEIKALSSKLTGKASTDAAVYDQLVPKIEDAVNQFKTVKPASELKSNFDQFNQLNDQLVAQTKKAQAAAKAGDQKGYAAAEQGIKSISSQSSLQASKLGAAQCING